MLKSIKLFFLTIKPIKFMPIVIKTTNPGYHVETRITLLVSESNLVTAEGRDLLIREADGQETPLTNGTYNLAVDAPTSSAINAALAPILQAAYQ